MASVRTAANAGKQLSNRAVHLKIHPRPANIAESREVLRILQSFGEVAMFKNLIYEPFNPAPNSAIAIYQTAESASKLLKASPLRFTLERVSGVEVAGEQEGEASGDEAIDAEFTIGRGPGRTDAEELVRPSTLLQGAAGDGKWGSFGHTQSEPAQSSAPAKTSSDTSGATINTSDQPKTSAITTGEHMASATEFQLVADISHMNHRKYLEESPYYGGFRVGSKSIIQDDLHKTVALKGLSEVDMRKRGPPPRIIRKTALEVAQRKTLRQLWEEGMKNTTAQHASGTNRSTPKSTSSLDPSMHSTPSILDRFYD